MKRQNVREKNAERNKKITNVIIVFQLGSLYNSVRRGSSRLIVVRKKPDSS